MCPRSPRTSLLDHTANPADFVVRAEEHGVPQARHRVFVVCVRRDVAETLAEAELPRLEPRDERVTVSDVIGSMPRIRSRLSRGDSPEAWRRVVRQACEAMAEMSLGMAPREERAFRTAVRKVLDALGREPLPTRRGVRRTGLPGTFPEPFREWLLDPGIRSLPNHESRSHMAADLRRYLFAAAFAKACGATPATRDFPQALAANHRSWSSGSFSDRYRVQVGARPATTITSHAAKDGHYFIHPDPAQVRSFTVREAARLQTFPDNYFFCGPRTAQYVQVGNAVPPFLARQIAAAIWNVLEQRDRTSGGWR